MIHLFLTLILILHGAAIQALPALAVPKARPVQAEPPTLFSQKTMPVKLIEGIKVARNRLSVAVNREFKRKYLKSDFFAEYDPEILLEQYDYSVLSLPFLLNVITIVWISGETYYVDEMDTELYYSLLRIKKSFRHCIQKPHGMENCK